MNEQLFWQLIEQTGAIVKEVKNVLFITGAGISADSGLPTYRGVSGLYNDKNTDEGISIESALSGSMFDENPEVTWKYIFQIEQTCRGKSYNRGHEVIAEMESYFDRVCVLTQNIDGFHHRAGSSNVIDIHGHLYDLYCPSCEYKETVPDFSNLQPLPRCPECQNVIRPDVVLFEEVLSRKKIEALSDEIQSGFDLVFSIGTTSVFPYIAQPVIIAHHNNIVSIEINPSDTGVSNLCHIKIPETAAKTLNAIWMMLTQ